MAADAADIVAPRGRLMRGGLVAWAVLVYFFLFAPIILLVLFSFNANQFGTLPITGWTTHWYSQAFNDFQIQDASRRRLESRSR
jgi:ABC-type spermidine/putrescine transport system permease subunit II